MPIVIGRREVITKDVYMKESTKLLEEVVVSAGRFEQKLSNVTVSMDLVKAGDIARQAPTDITSTLRTLPGVDIVDKQPSMRGGSGWTYGGRCPQPDSGRRNEHTESQNRRNQLEHRTSRKHRTDRSNQRSLIRFVRFVCSQRYYQYPYRPSGIGHRKPASVPISVYMAMPKTTNTNGATKVSGRTTSIPSNPSCAGTFSAGIRNPIYEGFDLSHSRRIGNFDVSGSINLFTDEGYRQQGYNKRFRMGGNLTYHQPDMGMKILNYGLNVDFLSNQYGDFFIWRSPTEVYKPSPFTNMGREENNFHIDPFINYVNPETERHTRSKDVSIIVPNNIVKPSQGNSITDILGNMGTNARLYRI